MALSVVVCSTTKLADGGDTVTVATGTAVTLTFAVPTFPSLDAVMVAVPTATPVTTPFATVAIELLFDDHATVRPVSTLPSESLSVAVIVVVCPTTTLAPGGPTVTELTGAGDTVMVAVPVLPSLVAVIVAVPAETPVTTPELETVAMAPLLVVQTTVRFVRVFPPPSFSVAVSAWV